MSDNTNARRVNNRTIAIGFARLGIPVFPSSGKTPLIKKFPRLDTTITPEEREQVEAEYAADHDGEKPIHIGATVAEAVIKKLWHKFPDAVPSLSCGPGNLVVLDADVEFDGPRKLMQFFEDNGGVPEGAVIVPTRSGGLHVYMRNDGSFTNRAGVLKKQYGTDVRGVGGQTVAPGAIREDGKTYGTKQNRLELYRALQLNTLPAPPDFIKEAIGSGPAQENTEGGSDFEAETRRIVEHLEDVDWPEFETVFDPVLGYDLEALKAKDPDFAEHYIEPEGSDVSAIRMKAAFHLLREWPNMKPEELAVFYADWEHSGTITSDGKGSGNYCLRDISREWQKNQGRTPLHVPSDGDAFEAAEDEEDDTAAEGDQSEVEECSDDAEPQAIAATLSIEIAASEARKQMYEEQRDGAESDAALDTPGAEARVALYTDLLDQELKLLAALTATRSKASKVKPKNFSYLADIRTAEIQPLDWVIKGMVARDTTSVLAGLWGAGKTAVTLDLALHVAHGLPYRGRKTKKGVVVYVSLENPTDVERRIKAWFGARNEAGHDMGSDGAFVLHRGPGSLFRKDGKQTADETDIIRVAKDAAQFYGLPVAMIVIDTVSQAIAPGSDRDDANAFTAAMARIKTATGANVMALHHPTKAGGEVRGGGEFLGNVDTVLLASKDAKTGRGVLKGHPDKFRIADPRKAIVNYRLAAHAMDERDEDGDRIEVVLAFEDQGPDMPGVDDQDAPVIKVPDGPQDRVAMAVEVAREEAERGAAEKEPPEDVSLTGSALRAAINSRRAELCGLDGKPLTPLNRAMFARAVDKAVEEGGLIRRKSKFYVTS